MHLIVFRTLMTAFASIVFATSFGVVVSAQTQTTPCRSYTDGVRPTRVASAVVTKEQLVFDLCRAAYEIQNPKSTANPSGDKRPDTLRRLRTIAVEGRLVATCVNPRPTEDPVTDHAFLSYHDFGCGPFNLPTSSPAASVPDAKTWSALTCPDNLIGGQRPPYDPPGMQASKGIHGPITYLQVAYDTCYAASAVNAADQIDPDGRLGAQITHLLDKLEYEFELVSCGYNSAPSKADTDYALHRKFGCGSQ